MSDVPDFERPAKSVTDALAEIGSATVAGTLAKMGIRNPHFVGLRPFTMGKSVCGPAVTLQFMPKREDIHWGDEYSSAPERELHRTALVAAQAGDFCVVDARGNMSSCVFGEMMLTYFKGKGGLGVVIDGCIRDYPFVQQLDIGLWLKGTTPNYHTQTDVFPHAVNVPIACAGVFVQPGDLIVGDDDGAVVVPKALAEKVIHEAHTKHEWEGFTRMKLLEGGDLRKYYPLNDEARVEYEAWKKTQE
jgi:regulator of RNase E activity RraA